jgi:hypothetical protein
VNGELLVQSVPVVFLTVLVGPVQGAQYPSPFSRCSLFRFEASLVGHTGFCSCRVATGQVAVRPTSLVKNRSGPGLDWVPPRILVTGGTVRLGRWTGRKYKVGHTWSQLLFGKKALRKQGGLAYKGHAPVGIERTSHQVCSYVTRLGT